MRRWEYRPLPDALDRIRRTAYIQRMSEVKITALENGPLEVDGACTVLSSDGSVIKEGNKVFLCRCGHSAKKPMCDGSHKREGFVAS